jgi:hypothetical protein
MTVAIVLGDDADDLVIVAVARASDVQRDR